MNSNRFSNRSYESTNGGNTAHNALISGNGAMRRASSEASVTGGPSVAPVVRAAAALMNAVNNNNNAASSQGSWSPGRVNNRLINNNNNRMSVASSGIGSSVNASVSNLASVRGGNNNYNNVSDNNVRNALRNIERRNMMAAQQIDNNDNMLMNLNNAELAALENFAMSPGTPQHRNKRARK